MCTILTSLDPLEVKSKAVGVVVNPVIHTLVIAITHTLSDCHILPLARRGSVVWGQEGSARQ